MSKRLILVLALAFVVGIAFAAYAEVQNVKVSGDLTVLGIGRKMNLQGERTGATESTMASITRVKVDADLTDNVMATVRLLNERYWGRTTENNDATGTNTDIALDLAYATLKEFLYSPLTVTVGRQELHFGSEMIVGDPDTNNMVSTASAFGANNRDKDLSARKAFDAIRMTLNYDPLVVDLVAAKVANTNLTTPDDIDLYGVNGNYALNKKVDLEGYWFEKRTGRAATAATAAGSTIKKVDRVDTIGARGVVKPIKDLTGSLEMAYQFGKYVTPTGAPSQAVADRKAWALEAAVNYAKPERKYAPSLTALYSYFSGDVWNESSYATTKGTYRGWDPMFENQTTGSIANALFNQTNAHVLGGIASVKPKDDVTVKGEYYAYWWAKKFGDQAVIPTARNTSDQIVMHSKRFAGQEMDLTAIYDYTEDVQFSLMGGILIPGASFDNKNNNPATEVIGSMKVTF